VQRSLQSLEQKNTKEHIVHGAEGFWGAFWGEILPSLVQFGAPLPDANIAACSRLGFESSAFASTLLEGGLKFKDPSMPLLLKGVSFWKESSTRRYVTRKLLPH
jgi:hypothetical protein